jgi:hypothetical protein
MAPSIPTANQVTPSRSPSDHTSDGQVGPSDETFVNTGVEFLWVQHDNGGGSDSDLTIVTTKTIDGEAVADKVVTITKGEMFLVGPFPTAIYNDANGEVNITLDGGFADVTLWVIKPTA